MIFRPLIIGLLILLQGIGGKGGVGGKGGFGGVKGIPVPTLRCTSSAGTGAGTPSTLAIPICSAAQAGDFTLLFCDSAWNLSAIGGGWATIVNNGGNTWNFIAASKVLSSGDISTGTVTCNASGGDDMAGATATFIGATSGIRENQDSGFVVSCPTSLSTSGAVASTDVGIYWNSGRTNGSGATSVINPGSGSATSLQTVATTNLQTNSLLATQFMAGGAQTNNFTYTGLCANFDAIQVIVTP